MSDVEAEAVGWESINAALAPLYGDQQPLHWGTLIRYWMGGRDPLDGISAYPRNDPDHWHFVTFGFSELYQKEEESLPDVSGWGFELTFRLARLPHETQPPAWSLSFLQNLGRYVFESGNTFESGHHMNLNGPIALGQETEITAIGFCEDPELPPISTPNGSLSFLQVVGLTSGEYLACRRWNTEGLLKVLKRRDPLLVTDLGQGTRLEDPEVEAAFRAGVESEGSSTASLYNDSTSFSIEERGSQRVVCLKLGANPARNASAVIPGRLPFGHAFAFVSASHEVALLPGGEDQWQVDGDLLTVTLSPDSVTRIVRLLEQPAGTYELPGFSGFQLEIIQTPSP